MSQDQPLSLSVTGDTVRIPVRVMPRSSRTSVGGVRDGRLLIRVTAAPVGRAANDAAITAFARAIGIPARAVAIRSGAAARNKILEVRAPGAAGTAVPRIQALARESDD